MDCRNRGAFTIVVNTNGEGFARSLPVTHGSRACAVAIKADGALAAAERAASLLDRPFRLPVAPGEREIPAVRGECVHADAQRLSGGGFVETVERRGGRDYGAVDAPIRPAARTHRREPP